MKKQLIALSLAACLLLSAADNCPNLPAVVDLPWNGLDSVPHMGWNSYYPNLGSEVAVKAQADALVSKGLAAVGYVYVNLDDNWMADTRDGSGNLQANAALFPSGIASLATYMHNAGLKFGLYESPGLTTCNAHMGSGQHEYQDAATMAGWGADLLKYDQCNAEAELYAACPLTFLRPMNQLMAQGVRATGRDMVLIGLNPNSNPRPWTFGAVAGFNAWRVSGDESASSFAPFCCGEFSTVEIMSGISTYQQQGQYNDPDYLLGGNGYTDAQAKLQFTMEAMWSSPLVLGTNIVTLAANLVTMYKNADVLAIDHDALLAQATRISTTACGTGTCQIWTKPLANGSHALAIFNSDSASHSITANFGTFFAVHDVWSATNLGAASSYTETIPSFGITMLVLSPLAGNPTTQMNNVILRNGKVR